MAGPMSQVANTRNFLLIILVVWRGRPRPRTLPHLSHWMHEISARNILDFKLSGFRGRRRPRHIISLFKLPARRLTHKFLFPKSEYYSRPHGEDWFFHRQNVILHLAHVEFILAFVDRKYFATRRGIRDFCIALDDYCLMRVLGAYNAIYILGQITCLARLAASTENE